MRTRAPVQKSLLLALAIGAYACGARAHSQRDGEDAEAFYTTVYLQEVEALRLIFPEAAKVVRAQVRLSAAERRAVQAALGRPTSQTEFQTYVGYDSRGNLDGCAVIQEEIGKFKLITFIVGVNPVGDVRRVAVMVYRESRGGEVARRRFLAQYDGKTVDEPFSINRDIINISGATMSVNSLNHGVKKVLAVVNACYGNQPERIESLYRDGEEIDIATRPPIKTSVVGNAAAVDGLEFYRASRLIMGTLCDIEIWGHGAEDLRAHCTHAFDEIERVDRALSDYRLDSELSLLTKHGAHEPVPLSGLTAGFLQGAGDIAAASGGAFDITIGPLLDLWRTCARKGQLPSEGDIERIRPLIDYRNVSLGNDTNAGRHATLRRHGVRLDPGALGKGYAVDRAVAKLRQRGVERALVNFSGCIYAIGTPPGRDAWKVAVRDPRDARTLLGTLSLHEEAIAASGGYEKWLHVGNQRFSHILSPQSLAPLPQNRGAVVIASTATLADGWSTAAAVLGERAPSYLDADVRLEGIVGIADRLIASRGWTIDRNANN